MKSMDCSGRTSDPIARVQPGDGKPIGVGADVLMPATELAVVGMTCQNCRRQVQEAIEATPGVSTAKVDLDSGRARIQWKDGALRNIDAMIQAISAAGFAAHAVVAGPEVASEPPPGAGWRTNVGVGLGVLAVLMAGEWIFDWTHEPWFRWLSLALAMPVQFYCGARFYRGAWLQVKSGNSNMDTLVSLGSTAAFGFSVWELLAGGSHHLFFLESVAIVTLISVGHWLEAQMSAKAASALEALMHLAPDTAWRLEGTAECQVPVAILKPEDRLVLRPGDRVPTDAEVTDGHHGGHQCRGSPGHIGARRHCVGEKRAHYRGGL